MKYAEVAVNTPVHNRFHYHIPPELEDILDVGHLVRVAFGTAMQPAIVVDLHDSSPVEKTKPIIELLDPQPVMTEEHVDLALWLSETSLSSPGQCLWLMLPPGLTGKNDRLLTLIDEDFVTDDAVQKVILAQLKTRGSLRLKQLKSHIRGSKKLMPTVKKLQKQGVIRVDSILSPPTVKEKTVRTVSLAFSQSEADTVFDSLSRAKKQQSIIDWLLQQPQIVDVAQVNEEFGSSSSQLNALAEKGLITLGERPAWRDSLADRDFVPRSAPELTQGQKEAFDPLRQALLATFKSDPTPTLPEFGEGAVSPSAKSSDLANNKTSPEKTSNQKHELPPLNSGEGAAAGRRRGLSNNYRQWRSSGKLWQILKPLARQMRREPTPAEKYLWQALRRRKLGGYKFRRQQTIERFIVDFFCPEANLIIEVDGEIHQYTQEEDVIRQQFLEAQDFHIMRFTNAEVMENRHEVVERIRGYLAELPERSAGQSFLLHGVTGSGKTEIYLRAIELTLQQGRQAIFLVPEIALTPQTIRRVAERFPDQVAVVHGSLNVGERYDTWRRARAGEIGVIVGTRSALFTPLPDVGLIVMDEEHDHSYKQSPPILPPYYHARDVAEKMMQLNRGVLILGSATPDLSSYYRAQNDEITYLHLPQRIMGHRQRIEQQSQRTKIESRYEADEADALTINLPPVQLVDMRDELKSGNTSMFSSDLHSALETVLKQKEQAILFLNRRGQSTYVFCRDCGYVVKCPRCDSPMTYHRHGEAMRCHHCGYRMIPPDQCPECGSRRIKFFGAGTQQVEAEVMKTFPQARTLRWDADTASNSESHEAILQRFIAGEADIMIGTQMIAKGLDLPLVTLVGVVSADLGLALPDFRAAERGFQLLTQVAGRAGRGLRGGRVILQTYQPEHYAVQAASHHDYETFYQQEIGFRREMGYPPFRHLARILCRYTSEIKAHQEAEIAANALRSKIEERELTGTELIGPVPCFFQRIDRNYRWQVIVRSPDPVEALRGIQVRPGWHVDIDPVDLL